MNPNPPLPPAPFGAPPPPQTTSTKAILALVFSFFCLPVGLVLGILALRDMKQNPALKGRGLAIAGIAISAAGLFCCIPMQAAIAIPNFVKFQARAKQSECKQVLVQLYNAQMSHLSEQHRFANRFEDLGFDAPEHQRYAYFLEPVGAPDTLRAPSEGSVAELRAAVANAGVTPFVRDEEFTIACAGNVDSDAEIDVWTISSESQPGAPAGVPVHVVDDVVR